MSRVEHLEEADLVRLAQEADMGAIEELLRRHRTYLEYLAVKTLRGRGDVADVMQELSLQLVRSLPNFKGTAQFRTWAHRVCVNTCYWSMKKNGLYASRVFELSDELAATLTTPESDETRRFDQDAVQGALARLPDNQRAVIILVVFQDMDYATAARILGLPDADVVKGRLHRARENLKRLLNEVTPPAR